MIIIRCKGGLGNQMFQYAAARVLADRHGVELRIDASWFGRREHMNDVERTFALGDFALEGRLADESTLRGFIADYNAGLSGRFWAKARRILARRKVWRNDLPGYSTRFEQLGKRVLLDGYFQHPRFFSGHEDRMRKEFQLRERPPLEVLDRAEMMRVTGAVCIQVRRTDFVTVPATAELHNMVEADYYARALRKLRARSPGLKAWVFSDDKEWARGHFAGWPNVEVAPEEWDGPNYMYKFLCMSACRHHILANSTFGWWTAFIGANMEGTVMMPMKWMRGLTVRQAGLLLPGWEVV